MKEPYAIAITGMGGIFPQARNPEALWKLVRERRSTAVEVPASRWGLSADALYDAEKGAPDRVYSKRACLCDHAHALEQVQDYLRRHKPLTRRIDPEHLAQLDPLLHVFFCAALQALQDAGMEPGHGLSMGIVAGNLVLPTETTSAISQALLGRELKARVFDQPDATAPDIDPMNRFSAGGPAALLAELLHLNAGGYTLDAACASSLYALKFACDALTEGRVDAMLAGGVSRPDNLYTQMGFSQLRALSPDGVSAPFDERGNGLVVGEGAGLFVLRRLDDALREGAPIHGVIRGIGLSNDQGGRLLAPTSEGQLRAMRAAYAQAGWEPNSVDLIECHATGTPVGDAVEFESLKQLWQEAQSAAPRTAPCVLGSVKSNIGHMLTGAGAAAMTKVLLALRHETLPPSANFQQAPAAWGLDDSPFTILHGPQPWPKREADQPRRAAVSAFGFGGINAHVLLEAPPTTPQTQTTPSIKETSKPVAIVAMDMQLGALTDQNDFASALFGQDNPLAASAGGIEALEVALQAFRIPPAELKEMLPQQLLMLKLALRAWKAAGLPVENNPRAGVLIGLGLDMNSTNFHIRWMLQRHAPEWARALGLPDSGPDFETWLRELREAAGPALSANRTMGALGSVVASRIARELQLGGPSFTVSSEDVSGLDALEQAMRLLRHDEVDTMLVGAVDFAGDLRNRWAMDTLLGRETDLAEGGVILVLKRLADAEAAQHRVLAVIDDVTPTQTHETTATPPGLITVDAGLSKQSLDALSLSRWLGAVPETVAEDAPRTVLHAPMAGLGNPGSASGLMAFAATVQALHHRVLPGSPDANPLRQAAEAHPLATCPETARYWLQNAADGPRRAIHYSPGLVGNGRYVALREGASVDLRTTPIPDYRRPPEGVFVLAGADVPDLIADVEALRNLARRRTEDPIHTLAQTWWRQQHDENPTSQDAPRRAAVAARNVPELLDQLACLHDALRQNPNSPLREATNVPSRNSALRDRVFYSPRPLARRGKVAFVYPGSGNHFQGMGRNMLLQWPELVMRQERENQYLRRQYQCDVFWNTPPAEYSHKALIFGQVSLGAATTDWLGLFGVQPEGVIGYSLGETAALFSTRAWRDRDEMLRRIDESNLFTTKLGGECEAARKTWKLPQQETVDWALGVIDRPIRVAKNALKNYKQVYPLIANTLHESVVGGNRQALERFISDLKCHFIPIEGVTTVHCEVVEAVRDEYRAMHHFDAQPPGGVQFYSGAWGRAYPVTGESAAEAILAQALDGVDYPKVIEQAHADGFRIFLEMGPGNSCTRMIQGILAEKPHLARALCYPDADSHTPLYRTLAQLIAEGVPVDLSLLYARDLSSALTHTEAPAPGRSITLPTHHEFGAIPKRPPAAPTTPTQQPDRKPAAPAAKAPVTPEPNLAATVAQPEAQPHVAAASAPTEQNMAYSSSVPKQHQQPSAAPTAYTPTSDHTAPPLILDTDAHSAFLALSQNLGAAYEQGHALQLQLLEQAAISGGLPASPAPVYADTPKASAPAPTAPQPAPPHVNNAHLETPPRYLDREACMAFAIGKIGDVLGKQYAAIDNHPTRVRLPDEPLMLVDRILEIDGEPCSLGPGRVVTEHDVLPAAWYLDNERIPTCVAVEAGQADLFLSAFLGIDFETKGLAMYRLLDAEVTFHRGLAKPGEVIHYDIRIEKFFRHGNPWFFQFHYDSTINGEPFLTMRNGCAGFFSNDELDAGQGVVTTRLDQRMADRAEKHSITPLVPMRQESYDAAQLDALRSGDFATCFGPDFARLQLRNPLTLPGGMMRLVHRVTTLDPNGGSFGLGHIVAEADIHPDDWFITCHFVDDRVMPGTLMYECCMHTLRIYLFRMGWVGEKEDICCEPVSGITGRLKCRGQVLESTKVVTYEVTIKEVGYNPNPYAIADARMYADGKPIVDIGDMCMQLTGLRREQLEAQWQDDAPANAPEPVATTNKRFDLRQADATAHARAKLPVYTYEQVLAFAIGKPSEAFGDRYLPFDNKRKIARLPGPPYDFISRITGVQGKPWKLAATTEAEAQYEVPTDAWYFRENRQALMPFAVLLEVALQPCGWLAAYMGSALTSNEDLKFRNLGGHAVQYRPVTPESGMLTTWVRTTNFSNSGGMIIQHFDMEVWDTRGPVYSGDTYFGFFTHAALANQVGIREATPYVPTEAELAQAEAFDYPQDAPFPGAQLRMIDRITAYLPEGGPQGLGYLRGVKKVDPADWFFEAHFYQDPVCPGSLGLESFLQLLKVYAQRRWQVNAVTPMHTVALNAPHEWIYRGQVIPEHDEVRVEAVITAVDDAARQVTADGFLLVDGRVIYQMKDFTLALDSMAAQSV